MSVSVSREGKKWIQTSVALTCIFLGYIFIAFFQQLGDWFALEAKIPFYLAVTQVISVLIALGAYVYTLKNPQTSEFLEAVFHEIVKVVWPNTSQTWRYTVVIMIGVTIAGTVLWFFDFGAKYLLTLINKI